jgi:hypothetical protein
VGYGGWREDIKYKTNEKTNNNSKSICSFNGKCEEVDFRQ